MLSDSTPDEFHTPALVEQSIHYLDLAPGKTVLDATEGFGGHSSRIAREISPGGVIIGLDRDSEALTYAETRLAHYKADVSIILRHSNFGNLGAELAEIGRSKQLNACLFDLGVSSYQLDKAPGFSFRRDDYLDGRMNRLGDEPTVASVIAETEERELAAIFWELGQERFARSIARRITEYKARGAKLETTGQLVSIVEDAVPRAQWPRNIHVATRVFQALRIHVNRELEELQSGLNGAIDNLAPGGRIVVISYHSLEDGIVKSTFARRSGKESGPSGYSLAALNPQKPEMLPDLAVITRKPVVADELETRGNIRVRSAKLRAAQRIA